MKKPKATALVSSAVMILAATCASSASATFPEIKGVSREGPVTLVSSLQQGSSALWQTTSGAFANTCTASQIHATITGYAIDAYGPVGSLSFSNCTTSPVVVDEKGSLSINYIGTSTNGTVRTSGTKVTAPSPLGGNLTCTTGSGVDLGTLTGVKEGNAKIDIQAVLSCGFLAPSVTWTASYTVTSPTNLGITMEFP